MTEITVDLTLVFIASAFIGGFIGAYIGYMMMYRLWKIDKEDLFDRLKKRQPKT